MSEKIKLSNGTEFNLVPTGISESEKRRSFTFTTTLSYANVEAAFANQDNYSTIQYILESGQVYKTYADCVSLKSITKDAESGAYTVVLSTDAVERALTTQQDYIDSAICELTLLICMGGMA